MIIAIDGYSSCGKSTLATDLAKALDITYIDSGAMYRAVTLYGIRQDIEAGDEEKIIPLLHNISISFGKTPAGKQTISLNGEDISEEIRGMEVSGRVSYYAKIKEVRTFLVSQQRSYAATNSIVMDGRDIGTVVFPNADIKLFLTADPKIRAQRRYDEMKSQGKDVTMEEVLENLKERDFIDKNRKESPLKKADDAFVLDNSYLNREQQLELSLQKIREKQNL